jgi:apolipoprotein N-acyltransferase
VTAFAAWFFLPLLLRFSRLSRPWSGFAWLTLAHGIVLWFQLDGVIPVPAVEYAITIAFSTVFSALVFLIDRVVAPRLPPVLATLVFPCVLLSMLFVGYRASPFGTWGDIAYTQTGFLLLLQTVSVVGIWGITFLIAWFAAIANLVLEQGVVALASLRKRMRSTSSWASCFTRRRRTHHFRTALSRLLRKVTSAGITTRPNPFPVNESWRETGCFPSWRRPSVGSPA